MIYKVDHLVQPNIENDPGNNKLFLQSHCLIIWRPLSNLAAGDVLLSWQPTQKLKLSPSVTC